MVYGPNGTTGPQTEGKFFSWLTSSGLVLKRLGRRGCELEARWGRDLADPGRARRFWGRVLPACTQIPYLKSQDPRNGVFDI